jgi:hypothetical protein
VSLGIATEFGTTLGHTIDDIGWTKLVLPVLAHPHVELLFVLVFLVHIFIFIYLSSSRIKSHLVGLCRVLSLSARLSHCSRLVLMLVDIKYVFLCLRSVHHRESLRRFATDFKSAEIRRIVFTHFWGHNDTWRKVSIQMVLRLLSLLNCVRRRRCHRKPWALIKSIHPTPLAICEVLESWRYIFEERVV